MTHLFARFGCFRNHIYYLLDIEPCKVLPRFQCAPTVTLTSAILRSKGTLHYSDVDRQICDNDVVYNIPGSSDLSSYLIWYSPSSYLPRSHYRTLESLTLSSVWTYCHAFIHYFKVKVHHTHPRRRRLGQ